MNGLLTSQTATTLSRNSEQLQRDTQRDGQKHKLTYQNLPHSLTVYVQDSEYSTVEPP